MCLFSSHSILQICNMHCEISVFSFVLFCFVLHWFVVVCTHFEVKTKRITKSYWIRLHVQCFSFALHSQCLPWFRFWFRIDSNSHEIYLRRRAKSTKFLRKNTTIIIFVIIRSAVVILFSIFTFFANLNL